MLDSRAATTASTVDRRSKWVKAFGEPAALVACDPPKGLRAIVAFLNFVFVPGVAYGNQLALGALGVTLIYGILLSLLLIPFADLLLGVFLTNPDTRALAYWPLVLWAVVIGLDTSGMVLMNALIGAGDTRRSMWISVIAQWVFFLPAAWIVGPALGFGLVGVWLANSLYRIGQAVVCARQWASRRWAQIEL